MSKFARTTSIAITWSQNSCQLLSLQIHRNQYIVTGFWVGEKTKDSSMPNLIAQGIKALNKDENCYIVAGGSCSGWGFADLSMPAMPQNEMHNALTFELKKYTPISQDKLHWGYRLIPNPHPHSKQPKNLKLFYIKQDIWNQWLNNLGAIHHVDTILAPAISLIPLFRDKTVQLPDCEKHILYQYENSGEKTYVTTQPWKNVLSLEEALPDLKIKIGKLSEYPAEKQMQFIPTILLAIYGCMHEADKDASTLIPLPQHLKIKRNIASKTLSILLCIYIVLTIGFCGFKKFQRTAQQIEKTNLKIKTTQNLLTKLSENNKQSHSEFAASLKQELINNTSNTPPLPEVLIALTNLIEPPSWISQRIEWNSGLITFTLSSPENNLDLIGKLEDSPILGDVRQLSSSFIKNNYLRRIQLNARYDTPDEKRSLAQRRKEEKQQELDKKEAESKIKPETDAKDVPITPTPDNGDTTQPPAQPPQNEIITPQL